MNVSPLQAEPHFTGMILEQCKETLDTPGLVDSLRDAKFDVVINENFDYCGTGESPEREPNPSSAAPQAFQSSSAQSLSSPSAPPSCSRWCRETLACRIRQPRCQVGCFGPLQARPENWFRLLDGLVQRQLAARPCSQHSVRVAEREDARGSGGRAGPAVPGATRRRLPDAPREASSQREYHLTVPGDHGQLRLLPHQRHSVHRLCGADAEEGEQSVTEDIHSVFVSPDHRHRRHRYVRCFEAAGQGDCPVSFQKYSSEGNMRSISALERHPQPAQAYPPRLVRLHGELDDDAARPEAESARGRYTLSRDVQPRRMLLLARRLRRSKTRQSSGSTRT